VKITKVGSRGYLAAFDLPYLTNVYVINGSKHLFLCDTFLGPNPMKDLLASLKKLRIDNKPVVVFNSHHHYDHVWGNMQFGSSMIMAHADCRNKMEQTGKKDLAEFSEHAQGQVSLVLPNVVFTDRVDFPDEQVEFFHSPGHTSDSCSCLDRVDKVLFVGDNVESSIPYLNEPDVDSYESTLEFYLNSEWKSLVAGHDPLISERSLLLSNLKYVKSFRDHTADLNGNASKDSSRHFTNLVTVCQGLVSQGKKLEADRYYDDAKYLLETRHGDAAARALLDNLKKTMHE
jgi:glyoxylase-like metal-dependent hydrolase (beta-lactamase superfamily II)